MITDQFSKLKKNKNKYFALSWTLTQSNNHSVKCVVDNKIKIPYEKPVIKHKTVDGFKVPYPTVEKKYKTVTYFSRKSIIDLANEANNKLEVIKKHVSNSKKPNIIYIDNITNNSAVKLAMEINNAKIYKAKNLLNSGETLSKGEFLASANGSFKLIMQKDGNLVLYDMFKKAIWSSKTNKKGGVKLLVRDDGILTVYKKDKSHAWSSGKKKDAKPKGMFKLTMQENGNLVLHDSEGKLIWSSKTGR